MSLQAEWNFRRRAVWLLRMPYSLTGLWVAYAAILVIKCDIYDLYVARHIVPLLPWLVPALLLDRWLWPYFGGREEP